MSSRGPHHCAAVGGAVAEMVFRYLKARCQTAGGNLSEADIEAARSHFLASFPNAFNFFDSNNQRCMEASGSTAPAPFQQDTILGSLLLACGQKAARNAFDLQVARFGAPWLAQFFGGFAQYVREKICADADERLFKLYAAASLKYGAKLSVNDLLKEEAVQRVMRECLAPFVAGDAAGTLSAPLSDTISMYIATQRGIPKPDISKVTDQQVQNFLTWLPPQVMLALSATGPAAAARAAQQG
jgi:hypothetical protein